MWYLGILQKSFPKKLDSFKGKNSRTTLPHFLPTNPYEFQAFSVKALILSFLAEFLQHHSRVSGQPWPLTLPPKSCPTLWSGTCSSLPRSCRAKCLVSPSSHRTSSLSPGPRARGLKYQASYLYCFPKVLCRSLPP